LSHIFCLLFNNLKKYKPVSRVLYPNYSGFLSFIYAIYPPTQGSTCSPKGSSTYLILQPARFTMPPQLPSGRWALTPPFHHHPVETRQYIFCGTVCYRSVSTAAPPVSQGTALCAARTFLPPTSRGAIRQLASLQNYIV
jgi:hypothetical protein